MNILQKEVSFETYPTVTNHFTSDSSSISDQFVRASWMAFGLPSLEHKVRFATFFHVRSLKMEDRYIIRNKGWEMAYETQSCQIETYLD